MFDVMPDQAALDKMKSNKYFKKGDYHLKSIVVYMAAHYYSIIKINKYVNYRYKP
jgi:hypothetical protein